MTALCRHAARSGPRAIISGAAHRATEGVPRSDGVYVSPTSVTLSSEPPAYRKVPGA